jgi:hypothetical protein
MPIRMLKQVIEEMEEKERQQENCEHIPMWCVAPSSKSKWEHIQVSVCEKCGKILETKEL